MMRSGAPAADRQARHMVALNQRPEGRKAKDRKQQYGENAAHRSFHISTSIGVANKFTIPEQTFRYHRGLASQPFIQRNPQCLTPLPLRLSPPNPFGLSALPSSALEPLAAQ